MQRNSPGGRTRRRASNVTSRRGDTSLQIDCCLCGRKYFENRSPLAKLQTGKNTVPLFWWPVSTVEPCRRFWHPSIRPRSEVVYTDPNAHVMLVYESLLAHGLNQSHTVLPAAAHWFVNRSEVTKRRLKQFQSKRPGSRKQHCVETQHVRQRTDTTSVRTRWSELRQFR